MCGIPLTEGKQAGDQRQPVGLQTQVRQGESGKQRGRGVPATQGGVYLERANVLGCKTKAVWAVFWMA